MKPRAPILEPAPAIVAEMPLESWGLASLALPVLLSSLGTSIVNVALPELVVAFETSFQSVQWIVLAYLLVITSLVVSAGRLGDIFGRRRSLLLGIALFTGASLLCAVAPALWQLILARGLQGLGAALMMALSMAMVGETVSQARTGRAIGLLGTMSAIGTALGPSLGGLLIAGAGWRSIFLINLPLGLLAWWLAYRQLPEDRNHPAKADAGFDVAGTLLLAASLAAYALAMTLGQGRVDRLNMVLLVLFACGIGLFVRAEAKARSPLIRLDLLREPQFGSSLAQSALVSTVMMTTLVVGPFYLARGLGLDAAQLGVVMSAGPLVAALSAAPAGRIADRFGAHSVACLGLVGMLAGALALATLPAAFGVPGYLAPLLFMTASYALFQTANNTSVMREVGPGQRGVVSGMLNLSRNLGLITGASVMGAVFAAASASPDIAAAHAAAVAGGMRTSFAVAAALVLAAIAIAAGARRLTVRDRSHAVR